MEVITTFQVVAGMGREATLYLLERGVSSDRN